MKTTNSAKCRKKAQLRLFTLISTMTCRKCKLSREKTILTRCNTHSESCFSGCFKRMWLVFNKRGRQKKWFPQNSFLRAQTNVFSVSLKTWKTLNSIWNLSRKHLRHGGQYCIIRVQWNNLGVFVKYS